MLPLCPAACAIGLHTLRRSLRRSSAADCLDTLAALADDVVSSIKGIVTTTVTSTSTSTVSDRLFLSPLIYMVCLRAR